MAKNNGENEQNVFNCLTYSNISEAYRKVEVHTSSTVGEQEEKIDGLRQDNEIWREKLHDL
jgi:SUMO ligase MMS21 Smc5/6 complex component